MPPISCTSKWRWPSVRLAASRTVANAGTRMSSSDVPSATCFLNVVGARAQRLVGELLELPLQRVDRVDPRLIALDPPLVGGAEQLAGEGADHAVNPSGPVRCHCRTATKSWLAVRTFPMAAVCGNCRDLSGYCRCKRLLAAGAAELLREIGGGHTLVNRRFLLTFSSKSAPIRPLPRGTDCATVRRLRSRRSHHPRTTAMICPNFAASIRAAPRGARSRSPRSPRSLLALPIASGCSQDSSSSRRPLRGVRPGGRPRQRHRHPAERPDAGRGGPRRRHAARCRRTPSASTSSPISPT